MSGITEAIVGPLERRATRITGQAKLYDLVQDMARQIDRQGVKLDYIIRLLERQDAQPADIQ